METVLVTEPAVLMRLRRLDPQRGAQVLDFMGYLSQVSTARTQRSSDVVSEGANATPL